MRKELALLGGVALFTAGCNLAQDKKSSNRNVPPPTQDHTLVVETPFPTFTSIPVNTLVPLNDCVAEGGDSVAYGNINYMDKSYQVWTANVGKLADYMRPNLPESVQVLDFSIPEAGLSVPNFYDASGLIGARCKVVVLGPWINDFGRSNAQKYYRSIGSAYSTYRKLKY